MKLLSTLLAMLPLTACGTMTTLSHSDREVADKLKRANTNCQALPRVYSGVSYDMCKLNSNSESINFNWLLGIYLLDSVASAATDTIALPATIYRQNENGNLRIN